MGLIRIIFHFAQKEVFGLFFVPAVVCLELVILILYKLRFYFDTALNMKAATPRFQPKYSNGL
jgi:hypothetical protein